MNDAPVADLDHGDDQLTIDDLVENLVVVPSVGLEFEGRATVDGEWSGCVTGILIGLAEELGESPWHHSSSN